MKYDLLICDGDVVDTARSGERGQTAVGIAGDKIAKVAPALRHEDAHRVISANGRDGRVCYERAAK